MCSHACPVGITTRLCLRLSPSSVVGFLLFILHVILICCYEYNTNDRQQFYIWDYSTALADDIIQLVPVRLNSMQWERKFYCIPCSSLSNKHNKQQYQLNWNRIIRSYYDVDTWCVWRAGADHALTHTHTHAHALINAEGRNCIWPRHCYLDWI